MAQLSHEDAVAMFEALGFGNAAKWKASGMSRKLTEVAEMAANNELSIDDNDHLADCLEIVEELNGEIDVVAEGPTILNDPVDEAEADEEEAEAEVEEEAEVEVEVEEEADEEEDEAKEEEAEAEAEVEDETEPVQPKKKAKSKGKGKGKKRGPQGTGVIASIMEFLKGASEKNPLDNATLLKKLCERFPDRAPDSMKGTINAQGPKRVREERSLVIESNDKGRWINE